MFRNTLSPATLQAIDRATLIREPIALGKNLWIGRLDAQLEKDVCRACEPRGLNHDVYRIWRVAYALYRSDAPSAGESRFQWDPDGLAGLAIRMSRLVHPTSIGYQITARVIEENGERIIAPSYVEGWGVAAYVVDPQTNRLSVDQAQELRSLITAYDDKALADRVKSALFYFECAALTRYADPRWVSLTTACESLVHIDDEPDPANPSRHARATEVFVRRMRRLTDTVGKPVSDGDLRAMYRARSAIAHGQDISGLTPEKSRLYTLHEDALRAILRKAVLEPQFAATFRDDTSIQTTLPL
jgi:hypothetical protein